MSQKKKYTIGCTSLVCILCVILGIFLWKSGDTKKLNQEIEQWTQKNQGTFFVEQKVLLNDTVSVDKYAISRKNNAEYECRVYDEKTGQWQNKEEEGIYYVQSLKEILQLCKPEGYVSKLKNGYRWKKGKCWAIEYELDSTENHLEKIVAYGKETLEGELVESEINIRYEDE